jgi:hypothetical protein
MHDLIAARLPVKGALDPLNLTTDAAHARQQLLFFTNGVCHIANIGYPPILNK